MQLRIKLNLLKEKHGLSNQKIADLSGVPIGTVSGIMSGQTSQPGFEAVSAIVTKAFGESLDEFYSELPKKDFAAAEAAKIAAQEHHHVQVTHLHGDMKELAKEAVASVYTNEAYKFLYNSLKWWRAVSAVLAVLALIWFVWFTWDMAHPDKGLINSAASTSAIVTDFRE